MAEWNKFLYKNSADAEAGMYRPSDRSWRNFIRNLQLKLYLVSSPTDSWNRLDCIAQFRVPRREWTRAYDQWYWDNALRAPSYEHNEQYVKQINWWMIDYTILNGPVGMRSSYLTAYPATAFYWTSPIYGDHKGVTTIHGVRNNVTYLRSWHYIHAVFFTN